MSKNTSPSILNEQDVFVTFERLSVVKSERFEIDILLAELDGVWYASYEYLKRSDYYFGYYPSKTERDSHFNSRFEAINQMLKKMENAPKEVAEAVKNFRQPSLFA